MERISKALALALLGLALFAFTTPAADLPKSGTFNVNYGWKETSTVTELPDGQMLILGPDQGAMFDVSGKGLLHHVGAVCDRSIWFDAGNFKFTANGHCSIVDADGDVILAIWRCAGPSGGSGPEAGRCVGDGEFLAGTGKYKGIEGSMTFHGGPIGQTAHGYSAWKGSYTLP